MKLRITVHGVAYEVDVEVLDAGDTMQQVATLTNLTSQDVSRALAQRASAPPALTPMPAAAPPPAGGTADGGVAAPIAGSVQEVKCAVGEQVGAGQVLIVLEAMKMLTNITAPTAGTVKAIKVKPGDSVREGELLVEFT